MILKPTHIRKILPLMTFCLLLSDVTGKDRDSFHEGFEKIAIFVKSASADYSEISTDHNFAVSYDVVGDPPTLPPLALLIRLVGREPNATKRQCFIPYFEERTTLPMRRLNRNTILFSARANDEHGQKTRMKLILINMDNCKYDYAHEGNLSESAFIFPSEDQNDKDFTLILHDQKHCQGYKWCRLYFNPFYNRIEPLHFDFSPDQVYNIVPVESFNGNRFVVNLKKHNKTRSVRLYSFAASDPTIVQFKELITLKNHQEPWTLDTSPLSDCWNLREGPFHDDRAIRCAAFSEDGNILMDKTIVYPHGVIPWHVRSILNGIVLIVRPVHCLFGERCSIIQVALITKKLDGNNSIEIKHREYDINCNSMSFYLAPFRTHVRNDSIEIDYLCYKSRYVVARTIVVE